MSTDRLTAADVDTIVEAIEHFVIGPQYPEDPELRETWQPYIDKLHALKSGDPGVAVARHEHEFSEYTVCKICGLTEAAIEGCHHCADLDSIKNGRCWWCLQLLVPGVAVAPPPQFKTALEAIAAMKACRGGGLAELHEYSCPYCTAARALLAEPQDVEHVPMAGVSRLVEHLRAADQERLDKYQELIYAVASKYPGESRHETALRYIRQAEARSSDPADARAVRAVAPPQEPT